MKISRRDRNLLIFTALFCAFILYGNFVFVPQYNRIHLLQDEIAKKEQTITDTLSTINNIDSKISSTRSEISSMLEIIPYTKDTESLLKSLDGIIATSGIEQVAISFGDESEPESSTNSDNNNEEAQKPAYSVIPVDISAKGTYRQAINTMALLENQKRLFNYKGIGMTADENGNVSLDLSLEYYSLGRDMEIDTQRIEGSGKENPFEPIIRPGTPETETPAGTSTPEGIGDMLDQEFQNLFESMFQSIIQGEVGSQEQTDQNSIPSQEQGTQPPQGEVSDTQEQQ